MRKIWQLCQKADINLERRQTPNSIQANDIQAIFQSLPILSL